MFCSGPTKKYDQFINMHNLGQKLIQDTGKSHLSKIWIEKICDIYKLLYKSLNIPENYKIGFVNGSATGAMDMLFWNLLGSRPCNVLETGIFSKRWSNEIFGQLKIPGSQLEFFQNHHHVNNNFAKTDPNSDFIFTMVETANGFKWFDESVLSNINGLKICDLTSSVFCEEIDWNLIDAAGFSFQKALGGEAGLGCIVLSPKAIDRIHNQSPTPRFLKINHQIFNGKINNTVSLLTLNDLYLNLEIFIKKGSLKSSITNCNKNREIFSEKMQNVLGKRNILEKTPNNNANAILCLRIDKNTNWNIIQKIASKCSQYGISGIVGHPEYIPCWRFWIGPTVENIEQYVNHFMQIINDEF